MLKIIESFRHGKNYKDKNTVKPLLTGHLSDLPKCPVNGGCPPDRGL